MKKHLLSILFFILVALVTGAFSIAYAQSTENNIDIGLPEVAISPITIPLFGAPIDLGNFSIYSWAVFLGGIIFALIIAYWIFLFLRAGVEAMQSNGKPEVLADAGKKARSILISAALTFLVPIILSVIGAIMGIGNVLAWPKMFSLCNTKVRQYIDENGDLSTVFDSPAGKSFYFQYYIENPDTADSNCFADLGNKSIYR